jgi:predicted MPP superfamily phosphohydrolase
MKRKVLIVSLSITAIVLVAVTLWMIWGNVAVTVTEFAVESNELPEAFDGFRICQVSDLHNDELGRDSKRLIDAIKDTEPDIIVITGDLIDRKRTNIDVVVTFAKQAVKIAPTYYVNGNHEASIPEDYGVLREKLISVGVVVLENECVTIERGGEYIKLVGLNDQNFDYIHSNSELCELRGDEGDFSILLAHRPTDFARYATCGYDLVFSGHLHGGQFRLPFLGGLYAPSYGLFPEYDGGMYEREDSVLIVSRGVGNSSFPIRFNNPREIVLVELVKK